MEFRGYCTNLDFIDTDGNSRYISDKRVNVLYSHQDDSHYYCIEIIGYNTLGKCPLCAIFANDEFIPDDSIIEFAYMIIPLVKATHNLSLQSMTDGRKVMANYSLYRSDKKYVEENVAEIQTFSVSLQEDYLNEVWHIISENNVLYSVNNKIAGKSIFKIVKQDVLTYIRKKWGM